MILPGVALFGLNINQTLVSIVIGAITAGVVYQVSRHLTDSLWQQLFLTAMFIFGTVYWWNSVYGGVWYFNHAVAALFLFAAVYETLAARRPFTAGIFLGAAYITRLPTVWTAPFFLIMFTDFSKLRDTARTVRQAVSGGWPELRAWLARLFRISLPVLKFGVALSIFVIGFAVLNYIRFDTVSPEATYDHWHAKASLSVPGGLLEHGLVSTKHIERHAPIFFESFDRDGAHRRRRRHGQRSLHVLSDLSSRAAERRGIRGCGGNRHRTRRSRSYTNPDRPSPAPLAPRPPPDNP